MLKYKAQVYVVAKHNFFGTLLREIVFLRRVSECCVFFLLLRSSGAGSIESLPVFVRILSLSLSLCVCVSVGIFFANWVSVKVVFVLAIAKGIEKKGVEN